VTDNHPDTEERIRHLLAVQANKVTLSHPSRPRPRLRRTATTRWRYCIGIAFLLAVAAAITAVTLSTSSQPRPTDVQVGHTAPNSNSTLASGVGTVPGDCARGGTAGVATSTASPEGSGCGSSPQSTGSRSVPTTRSPGHASPTTPTCATNILSLSTLGGLGAGGTSYTTYEFTNNGPTTCSMTGYPGFAVLDAHGQIVQHAATRSTHPGTTTPVPITTVQLATGHNAIFLVSSSDTVPNPDCRNLYTGTTLEVYPPGQTTPILQSYKGEFCDLVIGPVQPGTS
jgi:hypothetical protein